MGNSRWVRSCTGALAAGAARGSGLLVGSFPLFVSGAEHDRSFVSILPSGIVGSFLRGVGLVEEKAARRAAWRRPRSRKVACSRLSQAASWRKRRAARCEVRV